MPGVTKLIPYGYYDIRNKVYDEIINAVLAGAHPTPKPMLIQVGGIPGAGKSTFCKQQLYAGSIYISFDAIMELIPDYQRDLYLLGSAESFKKWEIPARVIGYEILRRAVVRKLNIFLEHSGVNQAHLELFDNIKKLGYRTEIDYILCNPKIAYKRTVAREKVTMRHTPKEIIEERAALVEQYLEKYKTMADRVYIYDSSKNRFKLKQRYFTDFL